MLNLMLGKRRGRVRVRFEQAVYGSFPFWDKGYAILASSPGCRDEWIDEFRRVCNLMGEKHAGSIDAASFFSIELGDRGPRIVALAFPTGIDDRGRPGAIAFHALFLDRRDFDRIAAVPFELRSALRSDWTAATTELPQGGIEINLDYDDFTSASTDSIKCMNVKAIAASIASGSRVIVSADRPIDDLVREIWRNLSFRIRRSASFSTWSHGDGARFDLVAMPASAAASAVEADRRALAAETLPIVSEARSKGWTRFVDPIVAGAVVAAITVLFITYFAVLVYRSRRPETANKRPEFRAAVPDRSRPRGELSRAEIDRIGESLVDFAERFHLLDQTADADLIARLDRPNDQDLTRLLLLIDSRLRYRGPRTTEADRNLWLSQPGDVATRISQWEEHIRFFTPERRLPADFANGPLDWRLAALAWSFHRESIAEHVESASEIPGLLAEELAVPFRVEADPRFLDNEPLLEYEKFLKRLPRRDNK